MSAEKDAYLGLRKSESERSGSFDALQDLRLGLLRDGDGRVPAAFQEFVEDLAVLAVPKVRLGQLLPVLDVAPVFGWKGR